MPTMAEEAQQAHSEGASLSPNDLKMNFGCRWNNQRRYYEFPDGSVGMYSRTRKVTREGIKTDIPGYNTRLDEWEDGGRVGRMPAERIVTKTTEPAFMAIKPMAPSDEPTMPDAPAPVVSLATGREMMPPRPAANEEDIADIVRNKRGEYIAPIETAEGLDVPSTEEPALGTSGEANGRGEPVNSTPSAPGRRVRRLT